MKTIPQPIVELIQRLFKSNPKFFKLIQLFSFLVLLVSWIIGVLQEEGVAIPSYLDIINNLATKIGALTAIIMAQLPNQNLNDETK